MLIYLPIRKVSGYVESGLGTHWQLGMKGNHQQKLILGLRPGRRVRTHPTSFFRPLRPQRPDAIPNADCVLK